MWQELKYGGCTKKHTLIFRIMHPNAPTYVKKPIEKVYKMHETEKKRNYNEHVLQVEKGSFTPIVGSTFGGMGKDAERHHQQSILDRGKKERRVCNADIINYVTTRIRFSVVLRSILTTVRRVRGKTKTAAPISTVEFLFIHFFLLSFLYRVHI